MIVRMHNWDIRPVTPELTARYVANGWWTDETLGQLLATGLRDHGGRAFRVHSDTRPALAGGPALDGQAPFDPPGPALAACTSGTTADPKGVIPSHRTITCEIRQLGATQAGGGPPMLVGAPVGHGIGMLAALLLP